MSIYQRFSAQELDILRSRAQSAARSAQEDESKDLLTALVVMAGQEGYALPIEAVANVYEGVSITPIPCVPPFVSGVANIRGHIILALDLAALLGIPDQAKPETATLTVLANSEFAVALQVSSIRGIESFSASDLAAVPANIGLAHSAYVGGILPDGAVLLNVDAILSDPKLIVGADPISP